MDSESNRSFTILPSLDLLFVVWGWKESDKSLLLGREGVQTRDLLVSGTLGPQSSLHPLGQKFFGICRVPLVSLGKLGRVTQDLPLMPPQGEAKPKKAAGKDKSSDKKVQAKGKRGAKGKQAAAAEQETKEDLPAENGETKGQQSPDSDAAGEKPNLNDTMSAHAHHPSPHFLYNPEEYFYQLFCKCKFFSSSRNIFKKEGVPPHPIL
ncbi:uncharacterized protein LOC126004436 [Suncus etruscus]|uniref:uncharacterized protein LOC126004436 n=1 Tax=Suncus etruscus TaxID=109475 RepID=UPI00210F236B|nr:uncharacterized protein LOC126004436 [Suncus etruscus]